MIAYAETNACRRQIILAYFGDTGPAEAPDCCDNCRVQKSPQQPTNELGQLSFDQRGALVILDTVRRIKPHVGRVKLAQILKGSKARDIVQYHYDRSPYYGKFAVLRQGEIEELIGQLITLGYLKSIGGEYPVLVLTPQGEAAIQHKAAIPLKLPPHLSPEKIERKKAERDAGGTLEYTAELFAAGLSPEEIARRRGFSPVTIYGHLARLIEQGRFSAKQVVPPDILDQVERAIQKAGVTQPLFPIKELLPDKIDYNIIRCVVAGLGHDGKALGVNAGLSGENSPSHPGADPDPISSFLSQAHPRSLIGPWHSGWALGFHSRFSGATWSRSASGDLVYRLKYQGDLSVLVELITQTQQLLSEHPDLADVECLVPVPPSMPAIPIR